MRRTAKGFTLVEIMIVVAIIGILIAIAVPGFLRAREVSRRNSCQETQTKLDSAIQQYILENNLADFAAYLAIAPAAQTDPGDDTWASGEGMLVGEGEYIRFAPECPSGGIYSLEDVENEPPVRCDLSDRSADNVPEAFWHTYPQQDVVAP